MLMNIQEFAVLILKTARNGKMLLPTIILILFAWTKQASATRAPPKECYVVLLFHCDVGALESFRYSSTLQNIQILNVNSLCNKTSTKPYKD